MNTDNNEIDSEDEEDPTLYCTDCGAARKSDCDCRPYISDYQRMLPTLPQNACLERMPMNNQERNRRIRELEEREMEESVSFFKGFLWALGLSAVFFWGPLIWWLS